MEGSNTLFDSLKSKYQLRFKNRIFAAKILVGFLENVLKKMKIDKKNDSLLLHLTPPSFSPLGYP